MRLGRRLPDSVPANLGGLPVSLRGMVSKCDEKNPKIEKTYLLFEIEAGLPDMPGAAIVASQIEEQYRDFKPIDPVVRQRQEQRMKELGLLDLAEEAGEPFFGKIADQDVMWLTDSRPVGPPKLLDSHEVSQLTDTILNIQLHGRLELSDDE